MAHSDVRGKDRTSRTSFLACDACRAVTEQVQARLTAWPARAG
ncbi:hypothetical protein [Nonomuraea sp. NPDC050202]|jgi:hypothetical protein